MRSLRSRLVIASLLAFVGFWAVWMGAWYAFLTSEKVGLWDAALSSNATAILEFMPEDTELLRIAPVTGLPAHRFMRDDLSYQVWSGSTLLVKSPGAPDTPFKADRVDGFAETEIGGEPWRVVAVSNAERHVQVQAGKPRTHQRQIVLWLAATTFVTVSLLAGVLIAAIAWGVRWSLKPLATVQAVMQGRDVFDLTPLTSSGLPREVAPLVESFNHLLTRLEGAVQHERRFIADAAHEMRTPLAALLAQVHVAEQATGDAERAEALRQLSAGVLRTTRLTEQMLALAHVDAQVGELVSIDLSDVVRLVARDFEHQPQRQHFVLEPARIKGTPDALAILVRNLLDNATRHVPAHCSVEVRCTTVAQGVRFEVRDDGPGIPADARARVFDRFYRAPGTRERGSGIGLSLVQRIAVAHSARVELGEGPGFSVVIHFPG